MKRLGQDLEPDTLVGDLPIGKQQLVEIGRVLLEDVKILIMDEPTSALSNHEVDVLFSVMQDLRADDVTIIYISHKLDEFRRIGDYVDVLRDGSVVATSTCPGRTPAGSSGRWSDGTRTRSSPGPPGDRRGHARGPGPDASPARCGPWSTTSRCRSTQARSWGSTGSWAPGAPSSSRPDG